MVFTAKQKLKNRTLCNAVCRRRFSPEEVALMATFVAIVSRDIEGHALGVLN